jgi:hypothetical protein
MEGEERRCKLSSSSCLGDTPSRKDGIDAGTENKYRVWGCQLINEAGIMLVLYEPPPKSI